LPFDDAALARIHRLSGGVPRRINLLADRALLGAYAQGRQKADRGTVTQAAREVFGRCRPTPPRWLSAGVLAGALAVVAAVVLLRAVDAGRPARPAPVAAAASATPRAVPDGRTAAAAGSEPSGSAPRPVPLPPPPADPTALLAAALAQPDTAWRELALRWNVAIGEGDPCLVAAQAQLACFRSAAGGLAVVRQLARPGVLTLQSGAGRAAHAVLVALDERQATLQVGRQVFVLDVAALAGIWRGEFGTFWRTPPGWQEGAPLAADARFSAWIDRQLTGAGFDARQTMRDRVWAFQVAQGLTPDGLAGPMTLMRLSRAGGGDEPLLQGQR
jgi:general secretion pathway protein A